MKKDLTLYRIFLFLKFSTLTVAGGLNLWGIIQMSRGYVHWDDYIMYSIYFLGGTILTSIIANVFNQKVFKKSFNAFLKHQNLIEAKVLQKTEKAVLVSTGEELHTIFIERQKEGVGFVLIPAKAVLEGTVINWDGSSSEKEVHYVSGWKNPEWENKKPVSEIQEEEKEEAE